MTSSSDWNSAANALSDELDKRSLTEISAEALRAIAFIVHVAPPKQPSGPAGRRLQVVR